MHRERAIVNTSSLNFNAFAVKQANNNPGDSFYTCCIELKKNSQAFSL